MKTLSPSDLRCDPTITFFMDPKDHFRACFQRSLQLCVRHGFCVEESFGMIFNETLDEVALTGQEQAELYDELIRWAKSSGF